MVKVEKKATHTRAQTIRAVVTLIQDPGPTNLVVQGVKRKPRRPGLYTVCSLRPKIPAAQGGKIHVA